jgi:hypothetical protein
MNSLLRRWPVETGELVVRGEHTPTGELIQAVERMAAYGLAPLDIQRILFITPRQFEFYYQSAFDRGLPLITARVADVVVSAALGDVDKGIPGNPNLALSFLKLRGPGWSEKQQVAHSVGPNQLSHDERSKIIADVIARIRPTGDAVKPQFKPAVVAK